MTLPPPNRSIPPATSGLARQVQLGVDLSIAGTGVRGHEVQHGGVSLARDGAYFVRGDVDELDSYSDRDEERLTGGIERYAEVLMVWSLG